MSVSATVSTYAKYQLAMKQIDLANDAIKVLLMRDGFVFDKDEHGILDNIKGTIVASTIGINSSKELVDSGSGFLNAGFAPGNSVTMSGFTTHGTENNVTKIISTVEAGVIVFTSTSGLLEEAADEEITVTADDELADGGGYDKNTKLLENQVLVEDFDYHRAVLSCDNIVWTADGANIGPTPCALLVDDDATPKTIIGELNFGTDQTAIDGANFTINNVKVYVL